MYKYNKISKNLHKGAFSASLGALSSAPVTLLLFQSVTLVGGVQVLAFLIFTLSGKYEKDLVGWA